MNKPISVLFVNPSNGLSGDTRSLVDLIKSLQNEIKPIVLLTSQYSAAYDYFREFGIECIVHPYQLQFILPFWRNVKNVLLHPWRLRFLNFLRMDLPCRFFVKKKMAKYEIDIVHTNRSQVMMGYKLSRDFGAKHVWHIREYANYNGTQRKIYRGLSHLRKLINKSDARIVVSNPCREWWKLTEKNTWTIWDAVRSVHDCCYEKDKKPYILFCSNVLYDAKGVFDAIRAYAISGLGECGIRLKMIGNVSDDYAKQIKKYIAEYNCTDSVDLIPAQKDVKPYFAYAMAFINPSVNEGMGRTTAEAMFFGCPVIAHASGGTLDLVKHRETGYLFNTVEECAELMNQVCSMDQEEVILRAQDFARQNLSIEKYGSKIMEVYKTVLNLT